MERILKLIDGEFGKRTVLVNDDSFRLDVHFPDCQTTRIGEVEVSLRIHCLFGVRGTEDLDHNFGAAFHLSIDCRPSITADDEDIWPESFLLSQVMRSVQAYDVLRVHDLTQQLSNDKASIGVFSVSGWEQVDFSVNQLIAEAGRGPVT